MTSKESANGGTQILSVNPVESLTFKETKYKGYFVNKEGVVASKRDNKGRINYNKPFKILKQSMSTSGYLQIHISYNCKRKSVFVHRLVAETFYGDSDLTVDHKDGNKLNNRLDNLQFMTLGDNVRKSSLGKIPWNRINVVVFLNEETYSFDSIKEFCKFFDIRKLQITELLKNGVRKQNNSSKYYFLKCKKSQTTIEIHMIPNIKWKSKRRVE